MENRIFFSLFFVYFGHDLYNEFIKPSDVSFCSTSKSKKEGYQNFTDNDSSNTTFSDSFAELGHIICQRLCSFVTCDYNSCSSFCDAFFTTIGRVVCCFFPILAFCCNPNQVCEYSSYLFTFDFCFLHVVTKILLYFLFFRPIISTCTFLIRSFTYFVFVALFLRIHLLRFAIIIVSTLIYLSKYTTEIVNSYSAILSFIFEKENISCNDTYKEKAFDDICGQLTFMHKKIYFVFVKTLVVCMYLIITIGTFTINREALLGTDVQSIVGILVVIISPYAASLFLKSGNGDYLSDKDKTEINDAYDKVCLKNNSLSDDNTQITSDVRTQHQPATAHGEPFQSFIVVETPSCDTLHTAKNNETTKV